MTRTTRMTAHAASIWQDSAGQNVYVCSRHEKKDAHRVAAFEHRHGESSYGLIHYNCDLVGSGRWSKPLLCHHPQHVGTGAGA